MKLLSYDLCFPASNHSLEIDVKMFVTCWDIRVLHEQNRVFCNLVIWNTGDLYVEVSLPIQQAPLRLLRTSLLEPPSQI